MNNAKVNKKSPTFTKGFLLNVGNEGLEPPCGIPDLQSGAVASVPIAELRKADSTITIPYYRYKMFSKHLLSPDRLTFR